MLLLVVERFFLLEKSGEKFDRTGFLEYTIIYAFSLNFLIENDDSTRETRNV
jgi:hypothetical protein